MFQNEQCVLKRFSVHNDKERALFRNEVKKLRSLEHPCVVKLQVAFFVASTASSAETWAYIQLPYYEGGDLGRWIESIDKIR